MNGLLIFFASPSGGGKTTVIKELLNRYPERFVYSVSSTTRKPRPGEKHGADYYFLAEQEFRQKIDRNEFLEWEHVHDYYYGTDKVLIERYLAQGKHVLLDLDVNGTLNVSKEYPEHSVTIFLAPPSEQVLIRRLKARGTDSAAEIRRRLQRFSMEMEKAKYFQHVVVNDELEKTVSKVLSIISNYENKMDVKNIKQA
ncbi:MAG: guanylate kinase [Calditrichaeota bacterium]|nr:guanylate kinase [Calditrichota bacterium]